MPPVIKRLASIDVFRAITMLLMVFVNDLDPVEKVPLWIKHAAEGEDRLGFADTVFPAFLFIVGLSIPLAIGQLQKKGRSFKEIAKHVLLRTLALLVMGFFHVNLEQYTSSAAWLPKPIWEILVTAAFFLVWLDYPSFLSKSKRYLLQVSGIVLLLIMAAVFKGGDAEHPVWMKPYWWGILGLIGWAYLICAGIYLLSRGSFAVQLAAAVFFLLFSLGEQAGWLEWLHPIKKYIWIAGSGAMPAFTMMGVVISCLYTRLADKNKIGWLGVILPVAGTALIGWGFWVRPYGGIAKLEDTPAWVGICTGISILAFGILVWLVDWRQKQHWFSLILPAGTSALTCYLLPYFLYSFYKLVHFTYPLFLNEGTGGMIRSALVACLLVLLTGWMEKKHIRLKI